MSISFGLRLGGCLFAFAVVFSVSVRAKPRPELRLESEAATLVFDLAGGSLVDFRLAGSDVNPFVWDSGTGEANTNPSLRSEPRARGHFLCLDRWGSVSKAEQANGMLKHGEAARVNWSVSGKPKLDQGAVQAAMIADLPMAVLR